MLKSYGTLRVHPRDRSLWPQPLWIVLHADLDDLGDYFLYQTQLATRHWFQLQRPAWKSHISIVRGEIETDINDYDFDSKIVEFFYEPKVYQFGGHFCVNVKCDEAEKIRKQLGLSLDYLVNLHMTVGVVVQPAPHIQIL